MQVYVTNWSAENLSLVIQVRRKTPYHLSINGLALLLILDLKMHLTAEA